MGMSNRRSGPPEFPFPYCDNNLEARHIELDVVSLTLSNGHGKQFKGRGSLNWSLKDGMSMIAFTDGGEQLDLLDALPTCSIGSLVPSEDYLTLEGILHDGKVVSLERIRFDGYSIRENSPDIIWKFCGPDFLSPLKITEPTSGSTFVGEFLFTPSVPNFPGVAKITRTNNDHVEERFVYDWLTFRCRFGDVVATRTEDDLLKVAVQSSAALVADADRALGLAFCFVFGISFRLLASDTFGNTERRRTFMPRANWGSPHRFVSPLGYTNNLLAAIEPLLESAANFFATNRGRKAGNLLHMCLEASGTTITNRVLVSCVTLESLIKEFARKDASTPAFSESQKEDLAEFLLARNWDESQRKRIAGFLSATNHSSPSDILHRWADQHQLDISFEEIKAWKDLRPKVAHGGLIWTNNFSKNNHTLRKLNLVRNMITKVLLSAMDYKGTFYCYRENKPKHFTPTSL